VTDKVLHIALPAELAERLDARAEAETRSRSNMATHILRRALEDEEDDRG
jgi:metal-responsive CopG/Arc/MetJ family transcriptional regulator